MSIIQQIKTLIWQNNSCAVCGRTPTADLLCPNCRQMLSNLTPCSRCGFFLPPHSLPGHHCHPPQEVLALVTCCPYASPIKERLFNLKYHNRPQIAQSLSPLLAARWQQFAADSAAAPDVIVPVPLHPRRQGERGYNQSELLAKALAGELSIPVLTHAVERVQYTLPMHSLSPNERHQNLSHAFAPGRRIDQIRGKNILLLDDIITTGATVQYSARVLHHGGAANIWALAVCGHLQK